MDRACWGQAVDRLLKRDWCIGVGDAGIDDAQLDQHWHDGATPPEFVAWFAEKYDLIRFEPRPIRTRPASSPPPA